MNMIALNNTTTQPRVKRVTVKSNAPIKARHNSAE